MRSGQLRVVREGLGLTRTDVARMARVSVQAVKNWEQGRNAVPSGVGRDLENLEAWTTQVVRAVVQAARERDDPLLVAYRMDGEMPEGRGRTMGASWWRMVVWRAHLEVPGAVVVYPQEVDGLGSAEARARRVVGPGSVAL